MSLVEYQSLTQSDSSKERKKGWKKVINEVTQLLDSQRVVEVGELIKKSGYLINEKRYNSECLIKLLEICDEKFKGNINWENLKLKLINESDVFNTLYKSVRRDLEELNSRIPQGIRTYMFLLATEFMIRDILNSANYNFERNKNYNVFVESVDTVERIVEATGTTLNYIRRTENVLEFSPKDLDLKRYNIELMWEALKYIELATAWRGIKEISDIWSASDLKILVKDKYIHFNSKTSLAKERMIASISYNDISNAKRAKFEVIRNFDLKAKLLSLWSIRPRFTQIEKIDTDFINDVLFMGEESEILNGIKIKDILKAYNSLQVISERYFKKSPKKMLVKSLDDIAIIKKREFWCKLFKKVGIAENYIETIFDILVYSEKSRDLLDCPLYQYGDYYILLPSVVSQINSAKSLLSNLNARNIDVSFKGEVFEKHLINIIKKTGCKHATFARKVNGEQYQCDLILEINGDIIFVEAKNISPITSFRDYDKNKAVLRKACTQLNRIVEYIVESEDIESMLGLEQVKSVTKLVVSSIPIGKNEYYDDVYITDELYFSGYFLRRCPTVNIINNSNKQLVTFKLYSHYYEGPISLKQFKALLKADPIKQSIASKRITEDKYKTDEYRFTNKYFEEGPRSIHISDELSYKDVEKYV